MTAALGLQIVHQSLRLGAGGAGRLVPLAALGLLPAPVDGQFPIQPGDLRLQPFQLPPGLLGQTVGFGLPGQPAFSLALEDLP